MTRAPRSNLTKIVGAQKVWLEGIRSRLTSPTAASMSLSDLEGLIEMKRRELVARAAEIAKGDDWMLDIESASKDELIRALEMHANRQIRIEERLVEMNTSSPQRPKASSKKPK